MTKPPLRPTSPPPTARPSPGSIAMAASYAARSSRTGACTWKCASIPRRWGVSSGSIPTHGWAERSVGDLRRDPLQSPIHPPRYELARARRAQVIVVEVDQAAVHGADAGLGVAQVLARE